MEQFHLRDFVPRDEDNDLQGDMIKAAVNLLSGAKKVVAFTGAGISVESGIPDFRSSNGLWVKYDPAVYCNFHVFSERPELFWKMAWEMEAMIEDAQPNPAHKALAELESLGLLHTIITQNVDGLHQAAGSLRVLEVHGSGRTSSCTACKQRCSTLDALRGVKQSSNSVPRCTICDGVLKMDVILFGEPLPPREVEGALMAAAEADVMLIIGTSLTVSPANQFAEICHISGGKLIVCNKSSDGMEIADVALRGNAGQLLPKLVAAYRDLSNDNIGK